MMEIKAVAERRCGIRARHLELFAAHPRPQTLCKKRGVDERSKNKTVVLTCSDQIIFQRYINTAMRRQLIQVNRTTTECFQFPKMLLMTSNSHLFSL
jgi:hypothetical protein